MSFTRVDKKYQSKFNRAVLHPVQSWWWGEFRKSWGNDVFRIADIKGPNLSTPLQIITTHIPKTKYSVATLLKTDYLDKKSIKALKDLAKKEHIIFYRVEPLVIQKRFKVGEEKPSTVESVSKRQIDLLRKSGFVHGGKELFNQSTFWIDLSKTEGELLSSFNSKTRYNIRLSQRKGVKVKEDNSQKAFKKYLELTEETVRRQGFYLHTKRYHQLMWKKLHTDFLKKNKKPMAHLLTATYKGEVLSTWILFVLNDRLYYPYGSSTQRHKNVMANNLLMWEAIKFGKKLGLKKFDLWGRDPGKGFTKFKESYNPAIVEFVGTWDLPTSAFYWPYRILEYVRWFLLKTRSNFKKADF